MKKIMPYLVKVLFGVFVVAVFVGIVSMSFKGLGYIFPDDLFDQAIGLVLFDVAALVWFLVFVYVCESTMQYVFAALGFLVGLLGTIGLIGIEVGISSGMLIAAEMARPLTYIFIAVFVGHLVLIYARHASAPEVNAKISLGIDKAKIVDEGQRQAEKALGDALPQLGASIAAALVAEVMKDLNLRPQIIPGNLLPLDASVDQQQAQEEKANKGLGAVLFTAFQNATNKPKKYEQVLHNAPAAAAKPAQETRKDLQGAWLHDDSNNAPARADENVGTYIPAPIEERKRAVADQWIESLKEQEKKPAQGAEFRKEDESYIFDPRTE